jgi:hypothetical protein
MGGFSGISLERLQPESAEYAGSWDNGSFSVMPGGRPSSFQGVTEWGTRWPRAIARGTARGEAVPASREPKGEAGGHHPSVTP